MYSKYTEWKDKAVKDPDLIEELQKMQDDETKIEDCFYRDLAFGTGGLRGKLGAGTDRMNVYTVGKASQGLAEYVRQIKDTGTVAIGYDSRRKSELFARTAAEVFAGNGLNVLLFDRLLPTPLLAYATSKLNCTVGVMITASHNSAVYNGYKVYGADGCQITTGAAKAIQQKIDAVDCFKDVEYMDFEEGRKNGKIRFIEPYVYDSFLNDVLAVRMQSSMDRSVRIVYTPLNGTGLEPVLDVLKADGFENILLLQEQARPDGDFPTCPTPNPEVESAMRLGIELAKKKDAELVLATDPDCDRVGIAVRTEDGSYRILSANETGVLLLDYICREKIKNGTMPKDPKFFKTIVTTDLAERVASDYGVKTVNVLTGFKFIGEQITNLQKNGQEQSYVFAFEESCGFLPGTYVRDKDGVGGCLLIAEMFAFFKKESTTAQQRLEQIYDRFGYYRNSQRNYVFEGAKGASKMKQIMEGFRNGIEEIAGDPIRNVQDYSQGLFGLPKSDVLRVLLESGTSVIIRPSGTEPKIKVYFSICAENEEQAEKIEEKLAEALEQRICPAEDC